MIRGQTRWRVEKGNISMAERCFNGWWLVVLAMLTVSLLVLPPMLPPLPPPPMPLMLFPVGIMALLMALAFSPS
ncbi:hypothetical protein Pfo_001812 [Paulownia fortunei]|nr:hypothetical protein Pfo_001812 [Paulownia fortunei]